MSSGTRKPCCQDLQRSTAAGVAGAVSTSISESQRIALNRYSDRKLSREEKWKGIWDILFPGNPPPGSVYAETEYETGLSAFRHVWGRRGAEIIRDVLFDWGQHPQATEIRALADELMSAVMDRIGSELGIALPAETMVPSSATSPVRDDTEPASLSHCGDADASAVPVPGSGFYTTTDLTEACTQPIMWWPPNYYPEPCTGYRAVSGEWATPEAESMSDGGNILLNETTSPLIWNPDVCTRSLELIQTNHPALLYWSPFAAGIEPCGTGLSGQLGDAGASQPTSLPEGGGSPCDTIPPFD